MDRPTLREEGQQQEADGGDFSAPIELTLRRGEEEVKRKVSPFGRRNRRGQ